MVFDIPKLLQAMVPLSVAVERATEIVKNLVSKWIRDDGKGGGNWKSFTTIAISAVLGMAAAAVSQIDVFKEAPGDASQRWYAYALVGLMATGGSATWNNVLDLLKALKVKSEVAATAGAANPIVS